MNGFEHYSWWPSTGTCSLIASWPFQCHLISQTDSIHSFVRLERGKGLCFVDWVVMMEAMFILNRIDMMAHKIWERVDKPHNDNLFNRPEPRQQGPIQLCSATRVNLWPNINWQWGIVQRTALLVSQLTRSSTRRASSHAWERDDLYINLTVHLPTIQQFDTCAQQQQSSLAGTSQNASRQRATARMCALSQPCSCSIK